MVGFKINYRGREEELYEQLKTPTSLNQGGPFQIMAGPQAPSHYVWGICPLDKPLDTVYFSARNFDKDYALRVNILPAVKKSRAMNFGSFAGEAIDVHAIPVKADGFSKKFYTKTVGDVVFVSRDKKENEISIYMASNGDVHIDFGIFETNSFSGEEKIFPDLDGFKKDLEFFCQIVEEFVNGIYENSRVSIQDITANLRPMRVPKQLDPEKNPMIMSNDLFAGARNGLVEKLILADRPNVSFEQIGGQKKAVEEVRELAMDLESSELYNKWGTEPAKGVLLIGPPGNGKTLLAEALASSTKRKFFLVRLTDLINSLWGEQEKILQAVFDKAGEEPSIIYFDEIDAIATRRHSGSGLVQLVTVFLQNMGRSSDSSNITILASSNRPDSIDPAIKRAGRFDIIIDVPFPDEEGRIEIFKIHKEIVEKKTGFIKFKEIDFSLPAKDTPDMSGADIKEIIRRALVAKVREEKRTRKTPEPVSTDDILAIIKDYERLEKKAARYGFTADLKENNKKKRYLD